MKKLSSDFKSMDAVMRDIEQLFDTEMEIKTEERIIGRNKYNAYKAFDLNDLSEENVARINRAFNKPVATILAEMKRFEEHHKIALSNEKKAGYLRSLQNKKDPELPVLTKKILWNYFLRAFYENEGKHFEQNDITLENVKPLIYYFLDDLENFAASANVMSAISEPSLDKGLLIIGDCGCGKTSVMSALHKVMQKVKGKRFARITANELVNKYERCETNADKDDFFNWYYSGRLYIDDVKTERMASNYGKVNVIKDGLEVRYARRLKTYLTCNFAPDKPGDIPAAIYEFRDLYGFRVYDRLFEDFNILIFKGGSFRK